MAIRSFRSKATEDIAEGVFSKASRRILPDKLHRAARIRLNVLDAAVSLDSLSLPGFRLEKLSGDRKGSWSIRINRQYRICFHWLDGDCYLVEIVDYH